MLRPLSRRREAPPLAPTDLAAHRPDLRPGVGDRHADEPLAIAARGIRHAFRTGAGSVLALDGVELLVRRGELLAILGPSGCGKTTLLRTLAGLLEPTAGEVLLDGGPPRATRRQRAIGWLAQDDALFPWRTVAQNVALPLVVGRRGAGDEQVVLRLLARVGLADAAQRYPHQLSGGMRQRAALARALVARPRFLFLDEPFAHLDELVRERLGELLLQLHGLFCPTTVLVTHSVAEAVRLADRVVVLSSRPGRVFGDVPVRLERPRADDRAEVGGLVRMLKAMLAGDR